MRTVSLLCISLATCLVASTTAFGLTLSFGREEIAKAGVGCVAGYDSEHSSIAYFQGDTTRLNEHLELLTKADRHQRSVRIILHAGAFKIDNPEETLLGVPDAAPPIPVDWSLRRTCPAAKLLGGTCKCDQRDLVVEIWIANEIKLESLRIPTAFKVESAGEIEQFLKHRASQE